MGDPGKANAARKPNRLARESSPYLLLHASNPVDWYPWGEEAIARARREDTPIFLSIGYSTCYWCHVMEREDFADERIAGLMNRWFVNVKVDREEHPELDAVYMAATQLMTGRGGWPNSLFLTPDLEPFFAGSYFPPAARFGMPAFPTVLENVHDAWLAHRPELVRQAGRVVSAMHAALVTDAGPNADLPTAAQAAAVADAVKAGYDSRCGGFGNPPKFPQTARLALLWARALQGDADARRMVVDSLRAMGRGAIYDQLGGGFHRYATDVAWRVPHFEKMLYDNALLAELLAEVGAATGDAELQRLARGTCEFVLREMRLPQGGFASAIDAETDGREGVAYTWTRDELLAALGEEGFAALGEVYGFTAPPDLEDDRHTLFLTAPLDEHARRSGLSREQLIERLQPHLDRLRAARAGRPRPMVDDKALADWNGMMIAALAHAGARLAEPRYTAAARAAAAFVLGAMTSEDGTLRHAWRGGRSSVPAFLDDYASLIHGLLALHDATGDAEWLAAAERLAGEMQRRLAAPDGGYFLSAAAPDLLLRARSATDGATPSGNALAALDLLRLAELTGEAAYRRQAEAVLRAFASELTGMPQASATLALAALRLGRAAPAAAPRVPPGTAVAGPERGAGVVGAEAVLTGAARPDGWRPFEVRLTIADGWHVNANPASLDDLVPTRVSGRVRDVDYPAGAPLRLAVGEPPVSAYSGRVTIRGEAGPDAGSVTLVYQACDDRSCRAPAQEVLTLRPRS